MENCLCYYRVSSIGQISGDGVVRQKTACQKFAKQNDLTIVAEFEDGGVSGKTDGADRPALTALFDAVKTTGIKTVLVERSDRLARDLMVGEIILLRFRDLGVSVIASESGTSLSDDASPEKVLIRQMLGAIAHFDRRVVCDKLKAARDRQSIVAGRRIEGRKPLGFFPHEQDVIDRIRQLRRKPKGQPRLSYEKIAEKLNEENVPSRTGKRWHPSVVYGVLNRAD